MLDGDWSSDVCSSDLKELEEEKRLFYVAVTRAMDFLCMLAAPGKEKNHKGRLAYITENREHIASLIMLSESDIDGLYAGAHPSIAVPSITREPYFFEPLYTEPIPDEPALKWRAVTEDLDIRLTHGQDWVLLGRIFHTLFEELSKKITDPGGLENRALALLSNEIHRAKDLERLMNIIREDFEKLEMSGYLKDIIFPQTDSYAEIPFVLQRGKTVFRGRIDRIIIREKQALLYDYKTYPVKEKELSELIEKYGFQMDIYRSAAEKIFSLKTKSYILFTHTPLLIEV
jgi:ATP-dependent exoDNAse (exonuclease V) beta subunit